MHSSGGSSRSSGRKTGSTVLQVQVVVLVAVNVVVVVFIRCVMKAVEILNILLASPNVTPGGLVY